MRWFATFLVSAFIVTFVATVGVRASRQGEAFALGLACGGAAGLPASVLAFCLTQNAKRPGAPRQEMRPAYSPMLVVTGPAAPVQRVAPDFPPLLRPQPAPRPAPCYRVVGE